jgi:hypothetical protein
MSTYTGTVDSTIYWIGVTIDRRIIYAKFEAIDNMIITLTQWAVVNPNIFFIDDCVYGVNTNTSRGYVMCGSRLTGQTQMVELSLDSKVKPLLIMKGLVPRTNLISAFNTSMEGVPYVAFVTTTGSVIYAEVRDSLIVRGGMVPPSKLFFEYTLWATTLCEENNVAYFCKFTS